MTTGPGPGERPSQRTLVIIPTYNERENLPLIVGRVQDASPDVHILVVDDGSPDGTGELADELALADPDRVHVMHRTAKGGLGAAYLAGFAWGLGREYSVLVEMDADGSHAPEDLHRAARRRRRRRGSGDRLALRGGRSGAQLAAYRAWCSRAPPTATRASLLGVDIRDITAGYRAYRREVLEKIDLADVDSKGYCFQIDLTWRTVNRVPSSSRCRSPSPNVNSASPR